MKQIIYVETQLKDVLQRQAKLKLVKFKKFFFVSEVHKVKHLKPH